MQSSTGSAPIDKRIVVVYAQGEGQGEQIKRYVDPGIVKYQTISWSELPLETSPHLVGEFVDGETRIRKLCYISAPDDPELRFIARMHTLAAIAVLVAYRHCVVWEAEMGAFVNHPFDHPYWSEHPRIQLASQLPDSTLPR